VSRRVSPPSALALPARGAMNRRTYIACVSVFVAVCGQIQGPSYGGRPWDVVSGVSLLIYDRWFRRFWGTRCRVPIIVNISRPFVSRPRRLSPALAGVTQQRAQRDAWWAGPGSGGGDGGWAVDGGRAQPDRWVRPHHGWPAAGARRRGLRLPSLELCVCKIAGGPNTDVAHPPTHSPTFKRDHCSCVLSCRNISIFLRYRKGHSK